MTTEDRQTNTPAPEQTEQDALIAEMLRSAKGVELPSELSKQPIIHKGDGELPAPMTVTELRSGKYFYIYSTETGEKVPCLGYMLAQKLRQRLPNGKFRFTTVDPGIRPKQGTIKCMLHPDDPNRKYYDELGFRTCRKHNITNRYQLQQHMKRRHPQEWETIEEERKRKEREEDRALQRLLLSSQLPKEEKPKEEPKQEMPKSDKAPFVCDVCGLDFGAEIILNRHKEEKHK